MKKRDFFQFAVLIGSLTFFSTGCLSKKAEPIAYEKDSCSNCKMTISDRRFGGEIVTSKGKVFKFDALECLHEFQQGDLQSGTKVYVVDFSKNGDLIPSESAHFKIVPGLRSPMGKGILATDDVKSFSTSFPGRALPDKEYQWSDLQKEL